MATVATVLTFARVQAQTDSNGLTDTSGLIFANEALLDFRRKLYTAGVDASGLQEAYEAIVADVGTYLYPSDMAWLKAIELNYGDQEGVNYRPATQVDVANLPAGQSFSWLRKNASQSTPYWNDMGDWFEIFPTPTTANPAGIRIFYFLQPTEYSSTSSNIGYPETLDYRILGWRIASSYYKSLNKFEEAMAFDLEYEKRARDLISTLSRGSQQPIKAKILDVGSNGWQF